jgi:hypothetical protein
VSKRQFFALEGQPTTIDVPLVGPLKDGELAVVLSWTQGAKIQGSNAMLQGLDLHIEF